MATQTPINVFTGKEYKGNNAAQLLSAGHKDNRWATLSQWNKLGFKIKLGAHATKVRLFSDEREKAGENAFVGMGRVFNFAQVEAMSEDFKKKMAERMAKAGKTPEPKSKAEQAEVEKMVAEALARL